MDTRDGKLSGMLRDKNYTPRLWNAVRLNKHRCVNWTMAAGVVTMLSVSAAAWVGVATLVSRLVR